MFVLSGNDDVHDDCRATAVSGVGPVLTPPRTFRRSCTIAHASAAALARRLPARLLMPPPRRQRERSCREPDRRACQGVSSNSPRPALCQLHGMASSVFYGYGGLPAALPLHPDKHIEQGFFCHRRRLGPPGSLAKSVHESDCILVVPAHPASLPDLDSARHTLDSLLNTSMDA